jgi:hypothetical protein
MTKMKYSIDLDKNIIFCEFSGHVDAEKMIEHILELRNNPDFHKGLNTISDIRKATFSKGFLEMRAIVEFVKQTSPLRGDFKLALIVEQPAVESAKLYELLSTKNHVKVVFHMDEAEAWVGG